MSCGPDPDIPGLEVLLDPLGAALAAAFEDLRASLESLVDAGVPILKLQAASALRYVHHLHLADAIVAYRADPTGSRE